MLELTALILILAAAGFAQRGDDAEFWPPMVFGAVVILAYAGVTDIAAAVMGTNP